VPVKREIRPVFRRVLECFESKAEFARQMGVEDRQAVQYWESIGYIPGRYARKVSLSTGGKVTVLELLNEADKEEDRRAAERLVRKAARALVEGSTPAEEGASDA
jgi:hypothetical protein